MVAFILALLCGITGLIMVARGTPDKYDWPMRPVGWIIMAVGFLFFLGSVLVIVPSGHVGVITVFGKVQDDILHEGMSVIAPWADCHNMSIRQQVYTKAMNASSQGGVTFDLVVNIVYRLDPEYAAEIYRDKGPNYFGPMVEPFINDTFKNLLVNYEAEAMYTSARPEVKMIIQEAFTEFLGPQGVIVIGTPIENMDLPRELLDAIVARDEAEQEALRMVYVLQQEEREAERRVIEAQGLAEAQEIINSTLTPEYLQFFALQTYQGLIGSNNTTFVLAIGENGMPMILNPDN